MPRIFKVPCLDKPPRSISGDLIAEAAGSTTVCRSLVPAGCEYRAVSVLAYEDESLEFTSGFSSIKDLCEWLHSLSAFDPDEEPTNIVAEVYCRRGLTPGVWTP